MAGGNAALSGAQLLLPYYATTEGAYQSVVGPLNPVVNGVASYKAGGSFVDVVTAVRCTLNTDGTAGTRALYIQYQDNSGNEFFSVPAPATQPASSAYYYSFSTDAASAYGPYINRVISFLPMIPLSPGYSVVINWSTPSGSEYISTVFFIVNRFPTTGIQEPEKLIPTPVVVS